MNDEDMKIAITYATGVIVGFTLCYTIFVVIGACHA